MKQFALVIRGLFAIAAALQVVLAVTVFPKAWWISLIFLASAALLGRGALRGCRRNFLLGLILAIIGPIAVALAGIEPFNIWHHVVRIAVLTGMLVAWKLTRRAQSAQSPAQPA